MCPVWTQGLTRAHNHARSVSLKPSSEQGVYLTSPPHPAACLVPALVTKRLTRLRKAQPKTVRDFGDQSSGSVIQLLKRKGHAQTQPDTSEQLNPTDRLNHQQAVAIELDVPQRQATIQKTSQPPCNPQLRTALTASLTHAGPVTDSREPRRHPKTAEGSSVVPAASHSLRLTRTQAAQPPLADCI